MKISTNRQPIGGRTFGLCLLLALSAFLNYVDRGTLSVAAPLLKGELHLTASQLGNLLGAFFLTYTAMMIFTGWMASMSAGSWRADWSSGRWPRLRPGW
jgi:MFS family permease